MCVACCTGVLLFTWHCASLVAHRDVGTSTLKLVFTIWYPHPSDDCEALHVCHALLQGNYVSACVSFWPHGVQSDCRRRPHSTAPQVDRKLVKQTIMTSVYGVTFIGARAQISNRLFERGWSNEQEVFQVGVAVNEVTEVLLVPQ